MEPVWIFRPQGPYLTLQDILYEKLGRMLISSKPNENFLTTKESVRSFFGQIPRTLQSILLKKTLELLKQSEYILEEWPVVVYVVQMLFKKGFKGLDLQFTTKLKLACLIEILLHLAQEGTDLEILKLELEPGSDEKKLDIHSQMQQMLDTSRKLVVLELPELCNDEVFKLIGENCHRLQKLDAQSSPITDKGLHYLTQNMLPVDPQPNGLVTDWRTSLFGISDILMPLEDLVSSGKRFDCYQRTRSPLCQSLQTLELTESEVTYKGLLVVLGLVPNFQDFCLLKLDNLFLNLTVYRNTLCAANRSFPLPTFRLNSILLYGINKQRLEMITSTCPNLTYLSIAKYVLVPLTSFESLSSLIHLHLEPRNQVYQEKSIMEISPRFRNSLQYLTLGNGPLNCNLNVVLRAFPTLRKLWLYFPTFTWNTNDVLDGNMQNQNITKIKLDGDVTAEAILKLVECVINLEEIHVKNIVERPQNFLERLCSISESPKLNTFLVDDVPFVTTEEDLMFFLSRFKNIISVGRLPFEANFCPGFNTTKYHSLHCE